MRKDFLLFLSFLVDAGYIVSFRVTKDKWRKHRISMYFIFIRPGGETPGARSKK